MSTVAFGPGGWLTSHFGLAGADAASAGASAASACRETRAAVASSDRLRREIGSGHLGSRRGRWVRVPASIVGRRTRRGRGSIPLNRRSSHRACRTQDVSSLPCAQRLAPGHAQHAGAGGHEAARLAGVEHAVDRAQQRRDEARHRLDEVGQALARRHLRADARARRRPRRRAARSRGSSRPAASRRSAPAAARPAPPAITPCQAR